MTIMSLVNLEEINEMRELIKELQISLTYKEKIINNLLEENTELNDIVEGHYNMIKVNDLIELITNLEITNLDSLLDFLKHINSNK